MEKFIHSRILILVVFLAAFQQSWGQAIYEDERYVPETDSLTNVKLSEWQDLKFGLLMHWVPIVNGVLWNRGRSVRRIMDGANGKWVQIHRITIPTGKNMKI
ncbi:hypothetical protein [Maribacter aquimaris]|uniref:hypothetical protein n=1 Tax=Maribacter aquimaris TaxID=2737171 RepID=UPI00293B96B1|nr:hypothetical protein [Maribacter aquimaris]